MGHDFGDIGGVHTPQHLGEVRDGSASQQLLYGLDHNVRFRLPTFSLVTQNFTQHIAFGLVRSLVRCVRLYRSFHRLHHSLVTQLHQGLLVLTPGFSDLHPQLQKHFHAEQPFHVQPGLCADQF